MGELRLILKEEFDNELVSYFNSKPKRFCTCGIKKFVSWLVFYDISTLVSYFMPNPDYIYIYIYNLLVNSL